MLAQSGGCVGSPCAINTANGAASPAIPIEGGGSIIDDILAAVPWLAVGGAAASIAGDTVQNQQPQYVIRGGVTTPDQLIAGTTPIPGTWFMTGFSVTTAPNMTPTQLAAAAGYPNGQISVTTVAALLDIGVSVASTPSDNNPLHATATAPYPLPFPTAVVISSVFTQQPNPYKP